MQTRIAEAELSTLLTERWSGRLFAGFLLCLLAPASASTDSFMQGQKHFETDLSHMCHNAA